MRLGQLVLAALLAIGPTPDAVARDEDPFPPPIAVEPEAGPLVAAPTETAAKIVDKATPSPAFEDQVVVLVNQERLNNGSLPPLKHASELDTAAELHSTNMAIRDFFSHCDLDTLTQPGDRMTAAGYSWSVAAENIAAGYSTPADVMAAWMASSGHRANILRTTVREVGVGWVQQAGDLANIRYDSNSDCVADQLNQGPYVHYWTQDFGARSNPATTNFYPVVIEREAFEATSRTVNLYVYGPVGATQMRFSNDGVSWSPFEPYSTSKSWTLQACAGLATVYSQVTAGATTYHGQDTIWLAESAEELYCDGFENGLAVPRWSRKLP